MEKALCAIVHEMKAIRQSQERHEAISQEVLDALDALEAAQEALGQTVTLVDYNIDIP